MSATSQDKKRRIYIDLDETLIHTIELDKLVYRLDLLYPQAADEYQLAYRDHFDQQVKSIMGAASGSQQRATEREVSAQLMEAQGWQRLEVEMGRSITGLRPGAREFLALLATQAELYLCTLATRAYADEALGRFNLRNLFAGLICRDDLEGAVKQEFTAWKRDFILVDDAEPTDKNLLLKLLYLGVPLSMNPEQWHHYEQHILPDGDDQMIARHHKQVKAWGGCSDDLVLLSFVNTMFVK